MPLTGKIWYEGQTAYFEYGPTMATVEKSGDLRATKKWQVAVYIMRDGSFVRDGFRKNTYQTERAATIRALEIIGIIPGR